LTHTHEAKNGTLSANAGTVRAPLAGRIARTSAVVGETIKAGDPLIVIESMKMEHTLSAEIDGEIEEVSCRAGDQVMAGRVLVRIKVKAEALAKESA
jgi:biotin carboxyl carrier protein